ncbi:LCP family protein [Streptomyces sp. KR80]|uniref:LCP family protein n=1 Tax=Streptomyces sp. KR80 TaxID=3457426 RepID=UPI003FD69A08
MDAQGRGRAGDIDPADQWVFDPNTGDYRLRLTPSAEQSPPPTQQRAAARRASRNASPGRDTQGHREVPPQRSRRAGRGTPPPTTSRRRPKPKPTGKKKALHWTGGVMAFLLIAGCTGAYFIYEHFNGNLSTVDIGDAGSGDTIPDGPMNILLIGTDVRTGKGNKGYGDAGSVGHADTTILFHVSEDRTNATALSIPRDLITDIPDCRTKQEDGSEKVIPGTQKTRFNESLGQSGRDPGCTMLTVEKLTGLELHHFMMADFNAVKTLTAAVGGVDVCLAKDINDPKSHLKLSKGKHTIQGEKALAFVRTRSSVGFGGDLDRIKVQQQFLSSMIRKMKSSETLTDAGKLWDLATAATKALTVDKPIGGIKELSDLGKNLSQVNTKNITFATVPVLDNTDGATVVLNKAPAEQLFAMMRADNSLTEVKKKEKAKEEAKLKGPKADPSEVRVEILNGGGPLGAAQATVNWLQNTEGVLKSSNGGNATGPKQKKTTLEYAPNQADQARRLADMMGLSSQALKPGTEDAAPKDPMRLTLGGDFKGAGVPLTAPSKAPEGLQKANADKQVCAK